MAKGSGVNLTVSKGMYTILFPRAWNDLCHILLFKGLVFTILSTL